MCSCNNHLVLISSKETAVPIYDSIHKNKFQSWKKSDRTEKSSCTAMTEQA